MPHAAEWGVHGFSMVFQNRVLDQSMEKWGWDQFAEKRGTLHIFFGPALHRLRFFTIFLSMKIEQVESSEKKPPKQQNALIGTRLKISNRQIDSLPNEPLNELQSSKIRNFETFPRPSPSHLQVAFNVWIPFRPTLQVP